MATIVQPLGAQAAPLGVPSAQAIASRTDLTKAVAGYMNRTDLDPAMDSFIVIAEGRIALDLRTWQMVKPATLTQSEGEEWIAVPADWLEWDGLWIDGDRLDYASPDTWQNLVNTQRTAGQYSMLGGYLLVADMLPTGAPDIVVKASYYARIPALNDTDPAPWLLTQYPQVYLYAALVSACEYVKDDARAQGWAAQYQAMVSTLNSISRKALVSGSTLRLAGPRR
jgi:hypothetical protein